MNLGRVIGLAMAFAISVCAADETNHTSKFGGLLQDVIGVLRTNLIQSATNAPTNSVGTVTNVYSTNAAAAAAISSIPTDQLTTALRQALSNGLTHAVATLGETNGFLTNVAVRIPLPGQLTKAENTLREFGQGPLVDQFVATMNHAAEKAVPTATAVFISALSQMTIADARTLLATDSKTAATDYFRKTTTNQLHAQFLPIVKEATAQTGVTAEYKELLGKIPFGNSLFGSLDLDQYVTSKALDGLFTMVADEEKRIRENPQARITTLLEKVFGALQKNGAPGAGS